MPQLSVPTPQQLAAAIQAEILDGVRAGHFPPNLGSFEELHDCCDANCLGGTEELLDQMDAGLGSEPGMAAFCELMNAAIPLVDRWIRSGGIADVTLQPGQNRTDS